MDWRSSRNRKWIRTISLVLIVCFFYQDLVWAQGGTPVWSKGQNGNFVVKPQAVTPQGGISIPKDVAVTKEVYNSSNGDKTIINIQDAHASYAAQESIASILDSLITNYDIRLIAIEGSSGYIDTSVLRSFPDEAIRNKTAKYLMKKGKLSAGEFFSISSDKEIALYGVEEKPLYLENVEQFRNICRISEDTKEDISTLENMLNSLKSKVYSGEMLQLDKNSVLHQDGKIAFSDRWDLINLLAVKQGISYGNYENLNKLVESLKLEKKIDFNKANKERDALIDVLSKKMLKQDLEQLVLKSLSFKMNKISQGEYYVYLQELASRYGVDPEPYKSLITYTEYITLYESIDMLEIFEEVRRFEDSIKEKMFRNDYQRKLNRISRFISLVRDLYELKLTNGDLDELVKEAETLKAGQISDFIKQASLKYDVTIDGNYDLSAILDNIPAALKFYRTAEERNSVMIANTVSKMQREGKSVAALVTGGYHTKGITNILKQKETSYIVILPKFDSSKGERPYVAILTNKKEPYEKLLESGTHYLATTSLFASEDNFKSAVDIRRFLEEIVLVAMAQAKLKGQDDKSVASLWLDAFEARQRQLGIEGKHGLATRKELDDLIRATEIDVVKEGAAEFAIVSIGESRLKVVVDGDEIGVNIPTAQEITRSRAAQEILARRKGASKAEVSRIEALEKRIQLLEKTSLIEYLNKEGFNAILERARFDGKTTVAKEYVIARLEASGKDVGAFKGDTEMDAVLESLKDRVNAAIRVEAVSAAPAPIKTGLEGAPAIEKLVEELERQGIVLQEVAKKDMPKQLADRWEKPLKYVFISEGFYSNVYVVKINGDLRVVKLVGGILDQKAPDTGMIERDAEVLAALQDKFKDRVVEYRGSVLDKNGKCIAVMTKCIEAVKARDAINANAAIRDTVRSQIIELLNDIERETGFRLWDTNSDNFLVQNGSHVILVDAGSFARPGEAVTTTDHSRLADVILGAEPLPEVSEIFAEYGKGPILKLTVLESGEAATQPVLIETEKGKFVLVRSTLRNRADSIEWEASLLENLRNRGFTLTPVLYRTGTNRPFVEKNSVFYKLYEYKDGNRASWGNITGQKLVNAARSQALYHNAVKDIEPTGLNLDGSERPYPLADLSNPARMIAQLHRARDGLPDVPNRYSRAYELLSANLIFF
ncbi:MAG: hypothetical protein WC404_05045, partial [Candidatus Omnitrophota bacterium]